jgi:hypothetical protein
MKHRAALAAAALAAGLLVLIAGPSSGATVAVLSMVDAGCCSISDFSKLQNDPAGDLPTVSDIGGEGAEKAVDSPGPDVVGLKAGRESYDISPDAVNSVAAPETSVLTRVLIVFSDLRSTLFFTNH